MIPFKADEPSDRKFNVEAIPASVLDGKQSAF